MPAGIESIVSAYVRSKNRQALENMRELRRQLLIRYSPHRASTRLGLEILSLRISE